MTLIWLAPRRRFSRVAVSTSSRPSAMKPAPSSSPRDTVPPKRRERSFGSRESPCPEVCEIIAPLG
jgi:hypothetical protein